MTSKKNFNFEAELVNLNKILEDLQGDVSLNEISTKIKKAKEIYDLCKKELEEAKFEIEEVLKED